MKLEYELVRTERKTICITVDRDRKVIVRAPKNSSEQAISAVIESKRLWIWNKQSDPHKYKDPRPRKEYVTGETFLYLGTDYRLRFTNSIKSDVRLVGDYFEISAINSRNVEAMVRSWYMERARKELVPKIDSLAIEMGVSYSRVCVRNMLYRWGSCSPGGVVSFNWRIIQSPMIVVDYLIVHELAHILEPNHSPDFWNIVSVHVPSWVAARAWLKEHGGALEW